MWNMMVLYLDDPWMWNIIYDGFYPRWPLNVKYDIWRFCALMTLEVNYDILWLCLDDPWMRIMARWPLNSKYDTWWLCAWMTLESVIRYMMVLCFDNPWMQNVIYDGFVPLWPFSAKIWCMMILCLNDPWMQNMIYMMVLCFNKPWLWMMILCLVDPWMLSHHISYSIL
jgi:hypothetical protein